MAATRHEVLVPSVSAEAEEGVLVAWFVELGQEVQAGDLVAEVQVEKVSEEVYAPAAGRVAELLVPQGGVVRQGAPVAVLGELGAAAPAGPAPAPPPSSPAARRLARELGVDLAGVRGTGPGGRVVEAAAPAAVPLTPMRRTIGERLQRWLGATAQLTLTASADVTDLAAPFTAALVRACALALPEHPRLGCRWDGDALVLPATMDISIAVAVEDGLLAPVVRDASAKDVAALDREIAELAGRARAGRLAAADMEGGVFGVTNLGGHRVDAFTPLLEPPQVAILGAGRARPQPAVVDGRIVPRTLVALSLTFDHRAVDGDPAAAFLDRVIDLLEHSPSLS